MSSYIVVYDYEDFDGTKTRGIEEPFKTWEEAQNRLYDIYKDWHYWNIELLQKDYI